MFDLPFREGVEILILCKCMHHTPPLLAGFSHLIENRDAAIAADDESDQGHQDEGSGTSHPRAAVYHWNRSILDGGEELVDEVVQPFFGFGVGDLAVKPICELVMRQDHGFVGEGVLEFQSADFDGFFSVYVNLFEESDFVLLFMEFGVVEGVLREVAIALGLRFLNNVAQHKHSLDVVLLNHSPEVVEGALGDGSLSGDGSLAEEVHKVGINVVFYVVFVVGIAQQDASGLESHVLRVAIEFVLFWVFIEFFHMVLGLGHKGEQFEFGGQTALHPFESEFYLRNILAEGAQVLVLVLPLQRYILVRHPNIIINKVLFLGE